MFLRNSIFTFFVALSPVVSDCLAGTENVEVFLKKIDQLSDYQPETVDKESLMPAMESLRKSEGLEAALLLWKNHNRLPLDLAWWRSPYRSMRMLVVALYYSEYQDRDLDFVPRFEESSRRFNAEERDARLEEIAFVEKHLPAIRKKLQKVIGTR